ncbi:MAG TPA: sulfite exporter TauE/SafE family protein [Puia sp.]|uniref:sulfite exporter TauE/SafE family protein n=1 Tax=Puia sp. TaxID=2045100 RepID=UPI002D00C42E|nr:sulfite exporter TauE/SafE family protein [Puia sp.]HVU94149.1 sulfite exporter TauE/SafE family protein [Puia sp.]
MIANTLSALALGLLSSLHCVGMCGPLLLALPSRSLLYHVGRILTYSCLGLLFGSLGRHIYLAGWQRSLSIAIGSLILLLFIARRLGFGIPRINPLQRLLIRLWRSPSTPTFFILGMANGLLPCGMVYLALAAALTRTTTSQATLFMTCFGIGTLPLLITTQYLGRKVALNLRPQLRSLLPVVTVTIALLLILRGLNLGIPFISPRLAAAPGHAISCH